MKDIVKDYKKNVMAAVYDHDVVPAPRRRWGTWIAPIGRNGYDH